MFSLRAVAASLLLAAAAGRDAAEAAATFDESAQHCTDISEWGDPQHVNEAVWKCNGIKEPFEKECVPKTIQKCIDVPQTKCTKKFSTVCKTFMDEQMDYQITTMSEGPEMWCPLKCTSTTKMETIQFIKTVCKEAKKQACITKWEVNAQGQKVWAGNDQCREVTWQVCNPENQTKIIEMPYTTCVRSTTDCKTTMQAKNVTQTKMIMRQECTVEAAYTCVTTPIQECENVTVVECSDTFTGDVCTPTGVQTKWIQKKKHLVHCYLDDEGGKPERDVEISDLEKEKKLGNEATLKLLNDPRNVLLDPLTTPQPDAMNATMPAGRRRRRRR